MNDVINNLKELFDVAFKENMDGRGTVLTKMVTTFIPDAIQNLQAYRDMFDNNEGRYEFVCTKDYLSVGLLVEKDASSKPKRILARVETYSGRREPEYSCIDPRDWIHTGIFLSKKEWRKLSFNKSSDEILKLLGINKKSKRIKLGG